ncbi:sacsin N-terminal ATP-binding-like domain-containing protein [Pseudonocardia nigra]|uniref:sacsin N-terminal ATP-binding-like domain-containing protein n=1 Tax=Pseudonocardia nigra TaxID=1921578 RepID=UPI001C5FC949|nr:ATP-binding protein [Pseudonocardia nigra]
MTDPFGTGSLRAAVLQAWGASPTRFREDANAEEDLRLGGYADAWFVELAQNAADAARAAGVPGRLRVALDGNELRVANTGAPLDAAGVAALASLRASAKRDDAGSVGRFGVGFAAVLAVSDAPRIVGSGGGVAFSAARTAEAVAALPGPAAELARRGEPPILRLVWPADEEPPAGFDTEVRLPLRPGTDGAALLAQARATAADLLLALPDVVEIAVDGEVVRREDGPGDGEVTVGGRRFRLVRATGTLTDADALGQATEQRGRRDWTVCWALPLTAEGALDPVRDDVLHAPTASGERLALPARLIATLPLEPDRRRVRPGPAADRVLAGAATAYLDLVRAVAPEQRVALVPEAGFPRSELDGRLRELLLDALRGADWLPTVTGAEVAPGRAEWLDLPGAADRLLALLAKADAGFDALLATDQAPPAALGVSQIGTAALVDRLLGVECPPAWWRTVYAALEPLAETVPGLLDELRALPVPLGDGRSAPGPATVLLPPQPPSAAVDAIAALALPGLHLADPAALHPLLTRLGAAEADPGGLLEHPALLDAVDRSLDDAEAGLDVTPLAEAVLQLVADRGEAPAGLAALALPDAEGRPARADELMLPDAALRPLLADDVPLDVLDADLAAKLPRSALTAVGVLDGFTVVAEDDLAGPDHDLDDEDRWWDGLEEPPARLVAVRDLDLVADDAWPAALAVLAADRDTRAAITGDAHGYTSWWLARHARLGGRRPGHWRLPSAEHLAAVYDPPPPLEVDEAVLAAIGVRADLTVADTRAAADLLARLGDPERHPHAALVAEAHAALAGAVAAGRVHPADLELPQQVRALDGSVTDVEVAMVLDAPWLAAVLGAGELVIGGDDPAALADLLDLPLASDVVAGEVESDGKAVRWADVAEVVVACHTLGPAVPDGELMLHDELWVRVSRPVTGRFSVPTWRDGSGRWHAADPVRALLGLLADDTLVE